MRRMICSEQGKFSQEYWRISRKFNAVQGELGKQKWKVIDEQFLIVAATVAFFYLFGDWSLVFRFYLIGMILDFLFLFFLSLCISLRRISSPIQVGFVSDQGSAFGNRKL